jgi:signal peptidase II
MPNPARLAHHVHAIADFPIDVIQRVRSLPIGRCLRPASAPGILLVAALTAFAADQASKAWVFASAAAPWELAPGIVAGIMANNDGVMANLGGGRPGTARFFALCSLAEIGVAACWVRRRRNRDWRRRDAISAGLLAAGMLGNAADRLALGHVRDFLVVTPCPSWIFNLADVFIVVGGLAVVASCLSDRLVTNRPELSPAALAGA